MRTYRDPKAARLGCLIVILGLIVGWGLVLGALASLALVIKMVFGL